METKRTDAQKKADKKYDTTFTKITVKFRHRNEDDMAMLAWVDSQGERTAVIKKLIADKMDK